MTPKIWMWEVPIMPMMPFVYKPFRFVLAFVDKNAIAVANLQSA